MKLTYILPILAMDISVWVSLAFLYLNAIMAVGLHSGQPATGGTTISITKSMWTGHDDRRETTMDPILILQNSISTLGAIRPAVADTDSITVPIIRVRNDLI